MRIAKSIGSKQGQLTWPNQQMLHLSIRHREGVMHSWGF